MPKRPMIAIERTGDGDLPEFKVVIGDSNSESRHRVTMDRKTCEKLGSGQCTPERYVKACFRFLLDREAKESILKQFDVSVISRYFPEFERELPSYLSQP
jgi:hypothetical protein